MAQYKAKVLFKGNRTYPDQPKDMTTEAQNQHQARLYFETFGKIIQGPSIIGKKL